MIEFLNTETHTPVLLMNRLWSLRLREVRIWVNTVLIFTSRKTEIARSARGQKSQGPRAEDAMAEPYLVQKIWRLDNSRSQCSRAKQKLLRKHTGAYKIFWSQIGSLKSFTLTIPWNLAKPVKIFPGIIVRLFPGIIVRRHHTDR